MKSTQETIKENDLYLISEDKIKEIEKFLVHDIHNSQFEAWNALVPRDETKKDDDIEKDEHEVCFGHFSRKG